METEFDADFRQYIVDFPKDQLPVIHASTYGEHGMLDVLIHWLPEIRLQEKRNLRFTLQNGERQIKGA